MFKCSILLILYKKNAGTTIKSSYSKSNLGYEHLNCIVYNNIIKIDTDQLKIEF